VKNSTHYLFSLGIANFYGMFLINNFLFSLLIIPLSLIVSCFSWVPNIIDRYISAQFENEGVILTRNRHPLSHSPWTLLYFLPFLYLAQKSQNMLLEFIISLLALSWGSHLVLDSLNPGGLPLGTQPIFNNHPVKHYKFHWYQPKGQRNFRIARIPYNDVTLNRKLGRLGLFFFSMNIARLSLYILG
jgi:hypothetical protein